MNLTDFPQLAMKCGSTGLIPVFLEMTEALRDSIPDMIPFEVRAQLLSSVKIWMLRNFIVNNVNICTNDKLQCFRNSFCCS